MISFMLDKALVLTSYSLQGNSAMYFYRISITLQSTPYYVDYIDVT